MKTPIIAMLLGSMLLGSGARCNACSETISDLAAQGVRLSEPLSPKDIENANLGRDGTGQIVPFGAARPRWEEFKAKLRSDDLLYRGTYAGGTNIYVVRGKCVVSAFGERTFN